MQVQTQIEARNDAWLVNRSTGERMDYKDQTDAYLTKWAAQHTSSNVRYFCQEELDRRASHKLMAQQKADYEFRMEVVAELIEEGKAEAVALNLTNTEVKMLAEARRLGII
jgi:hypothetical protein